MQCPPDSPKPCWALPKTALRPGLDIFGYILSEIGLGEAARMIVRAADAAEIPAAVSNLPLTGRQGARELEDRLDGPSNFRAALNVGAILELKRLRLRICRRRWNIVLPYWELQRIPEMARIHADRYDCFWAPSTFISDTLRAQLHKPVHLVHQPVDTSRMTEPAARNPERMKVLCHFDYDSHVARKNPEAAVRAFQAAFPKTVTDVSLLVKTRGNADNGRRAWLTRQAQEDPRIEVVDRTVTRAEMTALVQDCHVYLSMHRSEGFGFGCAEALCAGLAVVATDYGGTTDFVTEATGFPISWKPLDLVEGDYVEGTGARWADPSVEHAAALLRSVYDDPATARQRTREGQKLLRAQHAPAVVGQRMRQVLEQDGVF